MVEVDAAAVLHDVAADGGDVFIRHQKRRGRVARAVEVGLRGLLRQGAAEKTGNLFRLAHIDAQHLGVGIRAAHERGVGHVGKL